MTKTRTLDAVGSGFGRRGFLSLGISSLAMALTDRFEGSGDARADGLPLGQAKSCVVLWLNGGPSHIDTFDPKPGAKTAGPTKGIKTAAAGIQISEHLPMLAARANHIAFLRGMTSKEGNHQRAQEFGRTGHQPNPTVHAPSIGSWIAKYQTRPGLELPPFVSLGGTSYGAGFLGKEYDPLAISAPGNPPDDMVPFQPLSDARDARRRAVLAELEAGFAQRSGDGQVHTRDAIMDRATKMMRSKQASAFSIDSEPDSVKEAYGDTPFGRGCLTARRLVETGVPFVEVTLDGWDTHKDNFNKTEKLMGTLDPAAATLLDELDKRGLLATTLIVCAGDFGRTPDINDNEGRDHYPGAWSAFLAGAGVRGGIAHGETDGEGRKVVKDATTVPDLIATVANRMGLDPATVERSPAGRPIAVTDGGNVIQAVLQS